MNISNAVVATAAKRLAVVELEPMAFGAATTVRVDIRALTLVAIVHRALDRSGDVAGRRRSVSFL